VNTLFDKGWIRASAGARARLRAPLVVAVLLALCQALAGSSSTAAPVSVSAEVVSAISLGNSCTQPDAWNLGSLTTAQTATTATDTDVCRFTWSSSNDSAMLRMGQPGGGPHAMKSEADTMDVQVWNDQWHRASIAPNLSSVVYTLSHAEVRKSTDSGANWSVLDTLPAFPFDIAAASDQQAWAVGVNGMIERTTTGGAFSAPPNVPPGTWDVTGVDSVGGTTYVSGHSGNVWQTSNAGATAWTKGTGLPAADFYDVDASSASTAWAVGVGSVYRTNTTGGSWSSVPLPPCGAGCWYLGVAVVSYSTAYVITEDEVFHTTDGGGNWASATPTDEHLEDIVATGATSAVVVARNGTLLTTTTGTAFAPVTLGTANDIVGVGVVGTRGYALGSGGFVAISNDTGGTWTTQRQGTSSLRAVDASSSTRAWAVGSFGAVQRTTNGTSWAGQTSGVTADLRGVVAIDSTTGLAVGDGGTIITTSDGGVTPWVSRTSGTTQDLLAVDNSGRAAYAVGTGGRILRSLDAGQSWVTVRTGTERIQAVAVVSPRTAFAAGRNGLVLKTTDAGVTWTSVDDGTSMDFVDIAAADDQTLWVTAKYQVRRSSNGGSSWSSVATAADNGHYVAVAALSRTRLWAQSSHAAYRSKTGSSLEHVEDTSAIVMHAFTAVDASTGWAVGASGNIDRFTSSATPVSDYGGGTNWGSGSGTNMFGVCLQAHSGTLEPGWTVDVDGNCEDDDGSQWRDVPDAPTKVSRVLTPGATGQVDVVWGFRPSSSQPAGTYAATVVFEAVAPDV
jgi:photosystem II stability/assembly factor-like uncharacterized protein